MSTDLTLTPEQVLAMPAGTLATQPAEQLFRIKSSASDLLVAAKAVVEHVDHVLEIKWSERARNLRHDAGKDTGVVHFDEGNVRITADLSKKVDWDQVRLAEIARRIAEGGEDPRQYIEITYRVSETKFNAWPETIKTAFEAARTVRTGKASYRLALMKE
jgi:hypothetical protein